MFSQKVRILFLIAPHYRGSRQTSDQLPRPVPLFAVNDVHVCKVFMEASYACNDKNDQVRHRLDFHRGHMRPDSCFGQNSWLMRTSFLIPILLRITPIERPVSI
jgi:hypothetical protein